MRTRLSFHKVEAVELVRWYENPVTVVGKALATLKTISFTVSSLFMTLFMTFTVLDNSEHSVIDVEITCGSLFV